LDWNFVAGEQRRDFSTSPPFLLFRVQHY